ncbi:MULTISPECIES: LuxR C-terminal-related transcriptional regulator [unclassified Serratia (in: enterobacteria)]|uniref:LuxR C-terminal-related transcriptional regulator n=1 Tax=unclassified Serratia (in: enterobacteria) TaxID=2647522 RepID=UPI000469881F
MIYAISEDNFFTIGLLSTLYAVNIEVKHINICDFHNIIVNNDDIILLCTHSLIHNRILNQIVDNTISRVIYFVDADIYKHNFTLHCRGVISKKLAQHELINFLNILLNNERSITSISLSKSEVRIMNMLAQEKDAHMIGRLLKISAKTVFTHKLNALHKMGFHHLNSRGVLLYESIFQTRVSRSSSR